MSLHRGLSTKCASVTRVLGNFHLLDLLSERGTVSTLYRQKSGRSVVGAKENDLVPYLPVAPTSVHMVSREEEAAKDLKLLFVRFVIAAICVTINWIWQAYHCGCSAVSPILSIVVPSLVYCSR